MAKRERAVAENHGNEIHIQTSNREAKRISGRRYRGSQLPKSGGKMKRLVVLAITLAGLFYFPSPSAAGQGHVTFQSSGVIFKPAPRAGVTPNRPFYRRGYPVFALFLSTDSAHPALRKRLLLAVFGRHHIAVSLYFTQRSFCQSDRHDRSLGGHARDAARCRCIDLSRRGGQLYFSVLLSFS